jgi:carbon-monoxide dehydrogenase medium subunit
MLRPFRLLEPTTVPEAAAELERLGEAAKVYAGGAELVLLMRAGIVQPDYLVNVKRIPGLDVLAAENGTLRLGATVTHRRLESSPLVQERVPMLAACAAQIGNVRVRSQGTLGGNLCFADPHADPGTALLVYEAAVVLGSAAGSRSLSLEDFLVGTYETTLAPDELLVEVQVPTLPDTWGWGYQRFEQFHRPTLNAAAVVRLEHDRIAEARLAVGCAGPRPVRFPALEAELPGASVEEATARLRATRAEMAERLEPVDDLLGSAAYKAHLAGVLLARALAQAGQTKGAAVHA